MNLSLSNRSSLIYWDNSSVNENECLLCDKNIKKKDFPNIILKALSRKYCLNLNNYYFTKGIDKILFNEKGDDNIFYKEWKFDDNKNSYFKRRYKKDEYNKKFLRLYGYYKDDIFKPSIFIKDKFKIHLKYFFIKEKIKKKEEIYEFEEDSESSEDSSESLIIESRILKNLNKTNEEREIKLNKLNKNLLSMSKIKKKYEMNENSNLIIKNIKKLLNSKKEKNWKQKNHKSIKKEIKKNFKKKKEKRKLIKLNTTRNKNSIKNTTKNLILNTNKSIKKIKNKLSKKNLIFKTQNNNIITSNIPLKLSHHKKSWSNFNLNSKLRLSKIKLSSTKRNLKSKNKFSATWDKTWNFNKMIKKNNKWKYNKISKNSFKNLKLINFDNIKKKYIKKKNNTKNIFNLKINKINNKNVWNIKNLLNLNWNEKLLIKKNKTERNPKFSNYKNFSESRRRVKKK